MGKNNKNKKGRKERNFGTQKKDARKWKLRSQANQSVPPTAPSTVPVPNPEQPGPSGVLQRDLPSIQAEVNPPPIPVAERPQNQSTGKVARVSTGPSILLTREIVKKSLEALCPRVSSIPIPKDSESRRHYFESMDAKGQKLQHLKESRGISVSPPKTSDEFSETNEDTEHRTLSEENSDQPGPNVEPTIVVNIKPIQSEEEPTSSGKENETPNPGSDVSENSSPKEKSDSSWRDQSTAPSTPPAPNPELSGPTGVLPSDGSSAQAEVNPPPVPVTKRSRNPLTGKVNARMSFGSSICITQERPEPHFFSIPETLDASFANTSESDSDDPLRIMPENLEPEVLQSEGKLTSSKKENETPNRDSDVSKNSSPKKKSDSSSRDQSTAPSTSPAPNPELSGPTGVLPSDGSSAQAEVNPPPVPVTKRSRNPLTGKVNARMTFGSSICITQERTEPRFSSTPEPQNANFANRCESDSDDPSRAEPENPEPEVLSPEIESETTSPGSGESKKSAPNVKSDSSRREEILNSSEDDMMRPPKRRRYSIMEPIYSASPRKVTPEPENPEPQALQSDEEPLSSEIESETASPGFGESKKSSPNVKKDSPQREEILISSEDDVIMLPRKSPQKPPEQAPAVEPPVDDEMLSPTMPDELLDASSPPQSGRKFVVKSRSGRNIFISAFEPAKPVVLKRPLPPLVIQVESSGDERASLEKEDKDVSTAPKRRKLSNSPGKSSEKDDIEIIFEGDISTNDGASTSRAGLKEAEECDIQLLRPDVCRSSHSSSE